MTTEKQLVRKLSEVMNEVKYIQKKGYNKFHKYSYATESDVAERVREELAKRNVMMIPSLQQHNTREHTNRSGNVEYIVTVDMEFHFFDGDTGEEITFRMSGEGQDAGDKAIYKAITGAQKYALMKVFMIPTGDDPERDESVDERNHGGQQQPQNSSTPHSGDAASEKQVKMIFAKIATLGKVPGKTVDGIKKTLADTMGLPSLDNFSKQQASQAIEILSGWEKAVAEKKGQSGQTA